MMNILPLSDWCLLALTTPWHFVQVQSHMYLYESLESFICPVYLFVIVYTLFMATAEHAIGPLHSFSHLSTELIHDNIACR